MTARRPARGRAQQAYTGGEVLRSVSVIVWVVSELMDWLAAHPWVLPLVLLTVGAEAFPMRCRR